MSEEKKQSGSYVLSVQDRLALLAILPAEGTFATLRILQALKLALSLSEAEVQHLKLRTAGQVLPEDDDLPAERQRHVAEGAVSWLLAADPHKRFQFGPATLTIIREALTKLETAGKLREQHLGLYEQFVGGDPSDAIL
jgi:hypothetical protein